MTIPLKSYTRLREALNHFLGEALKANIRALAPTIASISWENDHETGDNGRSYPIVSNLAITLADGTVLHDIPDHGDMGNRDFTYWLENIETEAFPDDLEKALEERGNDSALAIIGTVWFGLGDGAKELPELFGYIAQLVGLGASQGGERALLEPAILADAQAEEAVAVAMAHLDAHPPADNDDPTD